MVVLRNDSLTLFLRPLGAKITSLRYQNQELLYLPSKSVKTLPKPGDVFDEKMAWGADICAPSVAQCSFTSPECEGYKMNIGDHGDFWTTKFSVKKQSKTSVTLLGQSKEFQLVVTLRLQGVTLKRSYTVTNITKYTLPFTFADHFLIPVNEKLKPEEYLTFPSVKGLKVEWSYQDKLGKKGSVTKWPLVRKQPFADKLFFLLKKSNNGEYWSSYKNNRLKLVFSSQELNYLGYWQTEGGWNNSYNLGLELSNTNADSLQEAMSSGKVWFIKPGKNKKWSINLEII